MRILIVEDDAAKLRRISEAALAVEGVDLEMIDHAFDRRRARAMLAERYYDLLVLDLSIPDQPNQPPREDAGLELLDELYRLQRFMLPGHIIGMTMHESAFTSGLPRFQARGLALVRYEPDGADWMDLLHARLVHITRTDADKAAEPREHRSLLFICCALRSPELEAVRRIAWQWEQHNEPGDDTIYYRGRFERGGREHTVFAAAASDMGMPAAAVLATKGILAFRPRYIGMPGIAAGIEGKTQMGDIIVATPCWDYGSGKWTTTDDRLVFEASPRQLSLDTGVRKACERLSESKQVLAAIKDGWPAERPPQELVLHIGALASGASVIADGVTAERVREQHRRLLGLEMEAYSVYLAAEEAPAPRPRAFAMKAVVDFASGDKGDRWQGYAAYVSAMTLQRLAEDYLEY
jgi:nucleoside phosphorylase/CheY-like chemotaxis protein